MEVLEIIQVARKTLSNIMSTKIKTSIKLHRQLKRLSKSGTLKRKNSPDTGLQLICLKIERILVQDKIPIITY